MFILKLDAREKDIAIDGIIGFINGNFVKDYELSLRVGADRDEIRQYVEAWKLSEQPEPEKWRILKRVFNELTHGIDIKRIPDDVWNFHFSYSREEVRGFGLDLLRRIREVKDDSVLDS